MTAVPDSMEIVSLASSLMFLPSILMSPLGAEMLMPVKASIFTLPIELCISTERDELFRSILYSPMRSLMVMPPVMPLHQSTS